jgi:hypothetical protein
MRPLKKSKKKTMPGAIQDAREDAIAGRKSCTFRPDNAIIVIVVIV